MLEKTGFNYSHEVEVLIKKGKKGKIDGLIQNADGTFKIIERKASDLTKVTDKTIKSYIDDAAKYNGKVMTESGKVVKSDKVILHVEKAGELSKDFLIMLQKKEWRYYMISLGYFKKKINNNV
ncbi:hypothetical protein [Chryseobacterium caseinilyticum]|uniref:Uncharacterized protein n=1 Tax=Chryseobacterium caseinilyticum TaxID=2771428 RepID=A0ABR8ZBA3_9FLAO|nr:hypothetical protein [Chryseobacterium caseinilyticum]MBD8082516.1 hypothetical protein [Chryseobacterium caseinilyticum]